MLIGSLQHRKKLLLRYLPDYLSFMLLWLILLTMANLSTNRTESLKILIEAGYEFLKDKVPMDLDENVDFVLQGWATEGEL